MRLFAYEIERINIVRLAEKYGRLPSEIMDWMGYPKRWCYENTAWQVVMVLDVMRADQAVQKFHDAKARSRRRRR